MTEKTASWVDRHPKTARLLRQGGLFVVVSNAITVFKALALMVLPGVFGFLGNGDFGFPGTEMSLWGIPFKWYIIGYGADEELIRKKMKLFGIRNMSAYLRKIAIDGRLIKVETSGLDELCRQVSGVSKNINQIAKRINSTNDIYADDVIAIKQELEKIWQLLKSTLSALL